MLDVHQSTPSQEAEARVLAAFPGSSICVNPTFDDPETEPWREEVVVFHASEHEVQEGVRLITVLSEARLTEEGAWVDADARLARALGPVETFYGRLLTT